jgi:hypothetical protein
MRYGYVIGGSAALDNTRRRWLAVLLAFSIGMAMVLVAASPAAAHPDAMHSGRIATAGGECSAVITLSNDAHDNADMKIVSLEVFDGATEVWDVYDGGGFDFPQFVQWDEPDERDFDVEELEAGSYRAEAFVEWEGDGLDQELEANFDVDCNILEIIECVGSACESFSDPNEDWSATCEGCSGSVVIREPDGNVADVQVTGSNPFTIVLTTDGKGPSPGSAAVDKLNDAGEFIKTLPPCGKKGTEPTTDCVHINRVNGNHTQFTIFFTDDPRFRFR